MITNNPNNLPITSKVQSLKLDKPQTRTNEHVRESDFARTFQSALRDVGKVTSTVKFSGHALQRLEQRQISLNEAEVAQLETAVEKLADKGARESLVISDKAAFIVNVPNRTVITAMAPDEAQEQIFTQIDSAVLLSASENEKEVSEVNELQKSRPAPVWGGLHAADRQTRQQRMEL